MALSKAHVHSYRELHRARDRRESGLFLVEGPTLIEEALKEGFPLKEALVSFEFASEKAGRALIKKLDLAGVPHEKCSAEELSRAAEAVTPQGAVAMAKLPSGLTDLEKIGAYEVILMCEAVSDPGNLGTLLRTADWFGLGAVILGSGSADPYSPKTVRSTAGSIFRIAIRFAEDLAAVVKAGSQAGRKTYAAVMKGELGPEALPHSGLRGLVIGHEIRGVSPEIASVCTGTVTIPGYGRAESLNLSVAGGILMYEITSSHLRK